MGRFVVPDVGSAIQESGKGHRTPSVDAILDRSGSLSHFFVVTMFVELSCTSVD